MRWTLPVATVLIVVASMSMTGASAQEEPAEPGVVVLEEGIDSQPETQLVRDDETSNTVDRIRRDLVIIALAMTAGLVVFVWHTSPSRRLRLAAQRSAPSTDAAEPD